MPNLKTSALTKSVVLLRSQLQPGRRTSLLASNRRALPLLGPGNAPSKDPKGNALRKIRLEKGIDPVLLATQACISLGQLYAIETGDQDHFYSPLLREQIAKRVANLLSADWDNVESFQIANKPTSNVIWLQSVHPPQISSTLIGNALTVDTLRSNPTPNEDQPVHMGLMTPSADVDANINPQLVFQSTHSEQSRLENTSDRNTGFLFISLLLVICAAFVFFFFEPAFLQALTTIGTALTQSCCT